MINGFLSIDKPSGITSHDVISILRRTLKQKKIGHTGTLDPFATGVLPVALGEGTKAIQFLDESVKEYRAIMRIGISTDTLDLTGTLIKQSDCSHITPEMIYALLPDFTGMISQIPPMYSAIKQDGVALYKLARKGETVERKERSVVIHSLVIDSIALPFISFIVRCSKGTYVRTLAEDIGNLLGVGAHLTGLRRVASGNFNLDNSITLDELSSGSLPDILQGRIISINNALPSLPEFHLTEAGYVRVRNGISPVMYDFKSLPDQIPVSGKLKLLFEGELLGIGEIVKFGTGFEEFRIKLSRLFNLIYPLQAQV